MARGGLRGALRSVPGVAGLLGLLLAGCGGGDGSGSGDTAETRGTAETSGTAEPGETGRSVHYRTEVMGTWGTVTIVTADSAASFSLAEAAADTWRHVDALLSNWKETSELSRVNREAAADTVETDRELTFVLGRALEVAEASGGAFDVTVGPLVRLWGFLGGTPHVPDAAQIDEVRRRTGWHHVWLDPPGHRVAYAIPGVEVDLGGIAKGYGVDLAYAVLRDADVSGMVDISGNIRTLGTPPGREAWVVGIRDPRGRLPFFAKLSLTDAAMATSGQYEQFVAKDGKEYGHILDPRTGWPAEGLLSVTVLAPTATDADAWATALFVLGSEAARALAKEDPDLAVVLVEDGRHAAGGSAEETPSSVRDVVWVESALDAAFELVDGADFLEVRRF